MEDKKINTVEENIEVEVQEESKSKKFFDKVGAGFKKHGKKVAGVAALGVVGLVAYLLGKNSNEDFFYDEIYDEDLETEDQSEEETE